MELQALLGDELYAQVQARIDEVNGKEPDKSKHVRYADLSEGNYVSKAKYDSKVTELSGVKQQLTDANVEIQSYKDMDIDGIKKRAADWEEKYNTDTAALNDKLAQQERSHQMDRYLDTLGLKPGAMYRDFVRRAIEEKNFKLADGKFEGADDFVKGLKENAEYKDAFVVEKEPESQEPEPQPNLPYFSAGTNSQTQEPKGPTFNFGFAGVRKHD